jgi:heme oxygenase
VIEALRAATGHRHELLHTLMPLTVESTDIRDYCSHLAILREWLVPLDAWLHAFADEPQASVSRPIAERIALIDADLSHHPSRAHRRHEHPIAPPHKPRWPANANAAYRWGVRYVAEGSRLGGAVLYARLKERFAPHPLDFLRIGSQQPGPNWQCFVRAMAGELRTPEAIHEACNGALDAFDQLVEIALRHAEPDCVRTD